MAKATKAKGAHVPRPGHGVGLSGIAYCGTWAHYRTGDHGLIVRQARDGGEGWCRECLAAMRREGAKWRAR